MARTARFQPFQWAHKNILWLGLPLLVVIAAFFRFWRLSTLPPGLSTPEALIGLQAQNLLHHGWLPGLTPADGYAPLWIWLQAGAIALFGHTVVALRLWPALLGVFAVVIMWLWGRDWFGPRIGWIAAFLVAITPWSVTASRNATPAALIPLLVALTFWVGTKAYHDNGAKWSFALVGIIALDLMSGPIGWLLAGMAGIIALVQIIKKRKATKTSPDFIALYSSILIITAGSVYALVASWNVLTHLPSAVAVVAKIGSVTNSLFRVVIMFNLSGDENFRHNLSGEPLLNAFVGLMFVAGLLVAISRYAKKTYRLVLLGFFVMLLPAIVTTVGVPNAARAIGSLPFVVILAAIGISYMLELWYSTFPINSAARATGQGAIILLLILSFFHGYTQYFRAWAGSVETYAAYNEPAVGASTFVLKNDWSGQRFVVATVDEIPVVTYLVGDAKPYTVIVPGGITILPITAGARQFVVTAPARNDAAKNLALKYPGGILKPHLSQFSQNEIYYVYEVTK